MWAPTSKQNYQTLPEGVFITEALDRRPLGKHNRRRDGGALVELAQLMADTSAEVLPRFVDLAMERTGAVSAGLSLYDANEAPDVFRWQHLRGTLARFENGTSPRDNSPCGVTLDRNDPVLVAHPERAYDWIAAGNIVLPEVLLVPLVLDEGEPLGTLWMVSEAEGHFNRSDAQSATELAKFVGIALRMIRQRERAQRALEEQEIVALEMSHRLKNIFAVTDGMIRGSVRHADTAEAMAEALSGRVHALASAHSTVSRIASKRGAAAAHSDMDELIRRVVQAHVSNPGAIAGSFRIEGDPIACGEHASNGIALIVHELATNALKYGALSKVGGVVIIRWIVDDATLKLTWQETGGPVVTSAPTRVGFGSTLIQRLVTGQFRGTLQRDWNGSGLIVNLAIPMTNIAY